MSSSGEKNMGDTVVTTLDADLQQAAYDALGSYKGAVVVMEASTGRILTMVSKPAYNPNTIAADWSTLNSRQRQQSAVKPGHPGLLRSGIHL